jgi:hypothetical protein
VTPPNTSLASQKPVDWLRPVSVTPSGVVQLAGLGRRNYRVLARRLQSHFRAPRLAKGISADNLVPVGAIHASAWRDATIQMARLGSIVTIPSAAVSQRFASSPTRNWPGPHKSFRLSCRQRYARPPRSGRGRKPPRGSAKLGEMAHRSAEALCLALDARRRGAIGARAERRDGGADA